MLQTYRSQHKGQLCMHDEVVELTLSLVVYMQIVSSNQLQFLIEVKCTRLRDFSPLFPNWVGATVPRCVCFVCDAAYIYLT
jgi:hypothetical protein